MKKLFAALLFAVLSAGIACAATAPTEEKYIVVEAEGIGTSREKAIEQAYMDAVRRSVGMFLDAKTEVKDNGISEKIISYSRGVVEKYDVIGVDDSQASRGRYAVKIRASVRRDQLRQGLEHAVDGGQTVEFAVEAPQPKLDPAALENANTAAGIAARQAKAGPELMKALLDRYPPEKFLKLEIASKVSPVDAAKEQYKVDAKITFQTDLYYNEFLPELTKLLDQLSDSKKKEFYRGQQAIADLRAIRDGKAVSSTNEQSVFTRHAANAKNYDVIVPGKINTFSYTGYKLKESVKKGVLGQLGAYGKKTREIAGVMLHFLDEAEEEISNQEQAIEFSYLTNGANFYPTLRPGKRKGATVNGVTFIWKDRYDHGSGQKGVWMMRNAYHPSLGNAYLLSIDGNPLKKENCKIYELLNDYAGGEEAILQIYRPADKKFSDIPITLDVVAGSTTTQESNCITFPVKFEIPKEIFELVKTLKIEFVMKH